MFFLFQGVFFHCHSFVFLGVSHLNSHGFRFQLLQRRHATKLQRAYLGEKERKQEEVSMEVVVVVVGSCLVLGLSVIDSSKNLAPDSGLGFQMASHIPPEKEATACNELLLGGCNWNEKCRVEKQIKGHLSSVQNPIDIP